LSSLLAGWLGQPDWSLTDILMVTHVDKLDSLMIINNTSFKFYCHLYYCLGGISLYIFFCLQVIKNNREERKERKKSCSLGYLDSFLYFIFISFLFLGSWL
jgi:hypothetical protein